MYKSGNLPRANGEAVTGLARVAGNGCMTMYRIGGADGLQPVRRRQVEPV